MIKVDVCKFKIYTVELTEEEEKTVYNYIKTKYGADSSDCFLSSSQKVNHAIDVLSARGEIKLDNVIHTTEFIDGIELSKGEEKTPREIVNEALNS